MKSTVIALLANLLLASHAVAADIYIDGAFGEHRFIHLRGDIVRGDYQRIISLIKNSPDDFLRYDWQLDSNGGDILEAIKIGKLIKELYERVNVADKMNLGARCASACFFIYVSAVSRNALNGAVGIHRPYFSQDYFANLAPEDAEKKYAQLSKSVRNFLADKGVPEALIEHMFSLASNEIYWLNDYDLESIGDRPAWFDQYLLSKCGFNSRMFLDAVERHDVDQARRWSMCESEVLYSQGRNAVAKFTRK
jgi:hypothetical protein